MLMLAAVLVIVAVAVYYVTRAGGYPALGVSAQIDNTTGYIQLKVETGGPVAITDWQYRLTQTKATGTWMSGTATLQPGTINLENKAATGGIWYVSVKHVPSSHLYLDDFTVTY